MKKNRFVFAIVMVTSFKILGSDELTLNNSSESPSALCESKYEDIYDIYDIFQVIKSKDFEDLEQLLSSNESVDLDSVRDENGKTPLIAAIEEKDDRIFGLLLKRSDINIPDLSGKTPLMYAASNGYVATGMSSFLPEDYQFKGSPAPLLSIDQINQKGPGGWTALMFACSEGHYYSVKRLLIARAKPFIENDDSKTASDLSNEEIKDLISSCRQYSRVSFIQPGMLT